jgi:hypothetical protein
MSWNLQGTSIRGRPENTRRRDLEKGRRNIDKNWRELEILARNRRTWNAIVTGLAPMGTKSKRRREEMFIVFYFCDNQLQALTLLSCYGIIFE